MQEHWISCDNIVLHCLDSCPDNGEAAPLLISPGLSEPAESYIDTIRALKPRRCIIFAHRGRGKSSAPSSGYTLEDHVEDIEAVVKFFDLQRFYLMGYSRGVSYALGYVMRNPSRLEGLILAEYPAVHKQMGAGWADYYLQSSWGSQRGSDLMDEQVVRGIERDARERSFRSSLHQISCPALVLRGTGKESLLSEEEVREYQQKMKNVQVVVFNQAGHTLKETEFHRFVRVLKTYLHSGNKEK